MTTAPEIVHYTAADRAEAFAFLERVYSPAESLRLKRQWDWKYDANPFNRARVPFILLLKHRAALVGMLGAIPLCVAVDGRTFPIMHSCDLAIERAFRGQGLAERLMSAYMSANPVGFGWLNERSHRRAAPLQRTGWTRISPLIKPLAPFPLLAHLTNLHSKRAASSFSPLAAPEESFSDKTSTGVTITQIRHFDERFDAFAQELESEHRVIGVRDRQFLNWRYAGRPDVRYVVLMATRGARLVGYLVLRWADKDRLRRGYLVDFLVRKSDALPAHLLIQAGVQVLRRAGAAAIQCLITSSHLRRALYLHGFIPWSFGPQPYFHARAEGDVLSANVFEDAHNWFLTMGDGDFEMSI